MIDAVYLLTDTTHNDKHQPNMFHLTIKTLLHSLINRIQVQVASQKIAPRTP